MNANYDNDNNDYSLEKGKVHFHILKPEIKFWIPLKKTIWNCWKNNSLNIHIHIRDRWNEVFYYFNDNWNGDIQCQIRVNIPSDQLEKPQRKKYAGELNSKRKEENSTFKFNWKEKDMYGIHFNNIKYWIPIRFSVW